MYEIVSIIVNIHCFALGSVVSHRFSAKSPSTKAQIHLDIEHSNMECHHESVAPHRPHALEDDMFLCALTSSVKRECFTSLHKNIRMLPGTCVFQRSFHDSASRSLLDDPEVPSNHVSLLNFLSNVHHHSVSRTNGVVSVFFLKVRDP